MPTVTLLHGDYACPVRQAELKRLLEEEGLSVFSLSSSGRDGEQLREAHASNRCDAAVCLVRFGDSAPLRLLQQLPIGVPKVIVTTRITGNTRHLVSGTDVFLIHADVGEMEQIPLSLLKQAAAIVSATVKRANQVRKLSETDKKRPLIGISMFGVTTRAGLRIVTHLERQGFEPIVFHATGSGGDSLEGMIRSGLISGVIELTPAEISGALLCRSNAAENRMQAAAAAGIPEVAVPGALDVLIFTEPSGVPERYQNPGRQFIVHSPTNTCGRTLPEELLEAGRYFVDQVNRATGPVAVMLPLKGLDAFNAPDGQWPEMAQVDALFQLIRDCLRKDVPLIELPFHINDEAFADAVAETFIALFRAEPLPRFPRV